MTSKSSSTAEDRLRRECLRLSRRLAKERSSNEALRQATAATLSSITFKVAATANRVLARVLGLGKGPTAWDQLQSLVETGVSGHQQSDRFELTRQPLLHAEASCSSAGMTLLNDDADQARLLIVGDPPPFETLLPHVRVSASEDFGQVGPCWGVLAVGNFTADSPLLDVAQSAAGSMNVPLAVFTAQTSVPGLPPETRLAGPNPGKDQELATRVESQFAFHRWLSDLRGVAGDQGQIPFTETAYLRSNPDIAQAINDGDFESASEHWELIGKMEFANGSRACHLRRDVANLGLREADDALRQQAKTEWDTWPHHPLISILVPVYKVELRWLKACVESVLEQVYPEWELCLVDDASGDESITHYLRSLKDPRIKFEQLATNSGISAASNQALSLASGEYVGLLDHDDTLTVDALWLTARVIVGQQADIIYSDEAKLNEAEEIVEPHFKPDFSWPQLLSQNYVSHFGVYRRQLVMDAGGFRQGYEGSQDHDLLLRVAARANSIFHISRVLYYWRKVPGSTAQRFGDKDYAWDRGVTAISNYLGQRGVANKGPYPGTYQVKFALDSEPSVTLLVPFRDQPEVLETCLHSVIDKTTYQNYEILGLNNQSQSPDTHALMERWAKHDRVRFVDFDQPFNFSAINNFGAKQSEAEHLLLLNNDVEVLSTGWLEAMLAYSMQPGVGAVGGLLLYPDRTIQHAGVILGVGGVAGHSHKYLPETHHGYFSRPHLEQNVSAVTGACLMVSRSLYLSAGGLDEDNLAVAFNDIDFCLRLREMGLENVYTPQARLVHHESKSRGVEDTPNKQRRFNREAAFMRRRHALALCLGDPFYNPSLSLVTEDFSLRSDIQPLVGQ
ncbi:MAG: glycosyltransferase [Lysobacterales bacterium]